MGRYTAMYEIEVRHNGLHKYRHIRGSDRYVVEQKAAALRAQWDLEWARRCEVEDRRFERMSLADAREAKKREANERTAKAQADLEAIQSILSTTLAVDDRIDWNALKDFQPFSEPRPRPPTKSSLPLAPQPNAATYVPKRDVWCWFSSKRKAGFDAAAKAKFEQDLASHQAELERLRTFDATAARRFDVEVLEWKAEEQTYLERQAGANREIDARADLVRTGDEGAIIDMVDMVLTASNYPDFINVDYELDYEGSTKSLIVEFELPAPDHIPDLREVKYIQSRDDFSEKRANEAEKSRLYDSLIYQMTLRTLHEIFEGDEHRYIDRVTFNGWVSYVDKATGADRRACIASLGANRSEFLLIDLSRVDPKECFRALKGVAAAKLIGLAPVAPLQRVRKTDARFIDGMEVVGNVNPADNLALMDWKDFEHLIRQVFEAEFSSANGEVRVTQASRDGGVDAVIFDPDPIRGGKTVVQAKRYVNPVEVGAVRELYGTMLSEGAGKGILVTTSVFGPDARKFVQDKPIVLIDGSNLLHLLGKMGVQARIDLKEAKEVVKARAAGQV